MGRHSVDPCGVQANEVVVRLAQRLVKATGRALVPESERDRLSHLALHDAGYGYDVFGLHADWVVTASALVGPLYRHYFRVTAHGAENIPASGSAIFVANHSGTLPFDAAMLCFDVLTRTEPPRPLRAVADHFVSVMPFVGTTLSRLGAVNGTMANLRHLLAAGEVCLIFPEGVPAIGKPLRERYQLHDWRPGHAELALRSNVPVIPVAIIGAEEQWPQLGRINTGGLLGIPYLPIVATPVPLPVHYHIHYGAPLRLSDGVEHDAPSTEAVERAAAATKNAVQALIRDGLDARDGVFR